MVRNRGVKFEEILKELKTGQARVAGILSDGTNEKQANQNRRMDAETTKMFETQTMQPSNRYRAILRQIRSRENIVLANGIEWQRVVAKKQQPGNQYRNE
jgi:hypothetical protein